MCVVLVLFSSIAAAAAAATPFPSSCGGGAAAAAVLALCCTCRGGRCHSRLWTGTNLQQEVGEAMGRKGGEGSGGGHDLLCVCMCVCKGGCEGGVGMWRCGALLTLMRASNCVVPTVTNVSFLRGRLVVMAGLVGCVCLYV